MDSSKGGSSRTVLLSNPSPFMTRSYLLKILTQSKFTNASITVNTVNQIASSVYITFANEADADKFLAQFNEKSFEPTLDM